MSLFSQRLPWHLPPNQLSQLLVEKRQAGRRVLDLTISNPTAALPELYTTTDLLAALTDPAGLRYQPSPRGDLRARQAIAGYYARRGLAVDPEHLVLCASTSEAYSWLFQLLCDPGQRVLFPQPSYPLLAFLGGLSSVEVAPYSLDFDGDRWRIDLASLREQLTPETRAVVLVSPNNPTGSLVHAAEWQELRALGREHRLALIVDEVFGDYRLDPDCDAADPALGSALLWASAKAQVPMWPVPMTMQTFVVLVIGMAYGARLGVATIALYLLEGALGLPVFAGTPEKGLGLAYMTGPTGGYLLGFVAGAWLCGWLAERGFDRSPLRTLAAMSLGHALIFVFGVTWLAQLIGFEKAFATGVVPFWAATIAKTLLGVVTLPLAWKWIGRLK